MLLSNILYVNLNCDWSFKCFAMMQFAHLCANEPAISEVLNSPVLCCRELYYGVPSKFVESLVANWGP